MTFTKLQQEYLLKLLSACVREAYVDAGYEFVTFRDGSTGVLKAPAKMVNTIQSACDHFSVAIGVDKYVDKDRKPVTVTQ